MVGVNALARACCRNAAGLRSRNCPIGSHSMSLEPLLTAPLPISLHGFAAISAFGIGASQLLLPKGTPRHRVVGWTWVILMAIVAISSFWIHTICTFAGFSPIHALSIFTLICLPVAVQHARMGRIQNHKYFMLALFFFALVIAGLFTLVPGRIMHDVVFGTQSPHGACA